MEKEDISHLCNKTMSLLVHFHCSEVWSGIVPLNNMNSKHLLKINESSIF